MAVSQGVRFPLPFRYPGGKYYALEMLRPFWINIEHDEYREPLVGGGSLFFNKGISKHNWLNDIDSELMTTYKVIANLDLRHQLISLVAEEIANKERWREVKDLKPQNELEIAFKYFYLNRTSFSGKLVTASWGYRPKRSLPPDRWHERIEAAGEKLKGVYLTSQDFEDVIKAGPTGKQTLLYVDPPYFAPPKHKHYRHSFDLKDHIRLAESLKSTNHKFFLTYDDVPEIRELYSWAVIQEAKFFYRVDNSNMNNGSRKIGFELIITNYKIPFQSVFK